MLPRADGALSPQQVAEGKTLACRAQPRSDLSITWLGRGRRSGAGRCALPLTLKPTERKVVFKNLLAACVLVLGFTTAQGHAQDYPTRPIKIIMPWPASGSTDILARLIGGVISKRTGQPVLLP